MSKAWCSIEEEPYCFPRSSVKFQSHKGTKKKLILTQIRRLWIVNLVWIHWWLWNDAQMLKQHRRGALSFFKVICQISRSHGTKNTYFDPNWAFPDCNFGLNSLMDLKWCTKLDVVWKRCPITFRGHLSNFKATRAENSMFWIKFEQDYKVGHSYQIPQICLVFQENIFENLVAKMTTILSRSQSVNDLWNAVQRCDSYPHLNSFMWSINQWPTGEGWSSLCPVLRTLP